MSQKQYSPIKTIYIKNFRNIGEAQLDFTESPIISLIGDNEAGKTSVVKAFAVCALHAEPRSQKDFIRDGTNGFGVAIELQDGTIVRRMKTATSNSYSVILPDKRVWELGKTESTIPQPVQDVMGLKEEPETKEFLHIRTYEDRLLFVATPASVNYKVMYDALKIDDITSAIKNGNAEANKLRQEVISADNGIDTLNSSLRAIRVYDMTHLINIKARLQKEQAQIVKLATAANLSEKIQQQLRELGSLSQLVNATGLEINEHEVNLLSSISRLQNSIRTGQNQLGAMAGLLDESVTEVSETETSTIVSICRTIESINSNKLRIERLSSLDEATEVDISEISKLEQIINRREQLNRNIAKAGALVELTNASEIDVTQLDHLIKAASINTKLQGVNRVLAIYDTSGAELVQQADFDAVLKATFIVEHSNKLTGQRNELAQYDDFCTRMSAYLKAIGAAVEICPKCGEEILIDMDKYKDNAGSSSEVVS